MPIKLNQLSDKQIKVVAGTKTYNVSSVSEDSDAVYLTININRGRRKKYATEADQIQARKEQLAKAQKAYKAKKKKGNKMKIKLYLFLKHIGVDHTELFRTIDESKAGVDTILSLAYTNSNIATQFTEPDFKQLFKQFEPNY